MTMSMIRPSALPRRLLESQGKTAATAKAMIAEIQIYD